MVIKTKNRHIKYTAAPALFLDRDGVINSDEGYVYEKERFHWIKGAIETISLAHKLGYYVFVVTNQSGVAHGYYTLEDVEKLMDYIQQELIKHQTYIDDWRCCPYHPHAKLAQYRQDHPWRKPSGGMLHDLMACWPVKPEPSFLIGDQQTDIAAALDAGIDGFLFDGGDLYEFAQPLLMKRIVSS